MTLVLVAVAGFLAGAVNAAAGGGSLLAFPALLAHGLPPLTANVTSTVGLVPGYAGGALAYRREIAGQRHRLRVLLPLAVVGTLGGAALLLGLPGTFEAAAPWLILGAVVLLAAQPVLQRRAVARGGSPREGLARGAAVAGGAYTSYFGAAVGVVLMALLGVALHEDLQRVNALKNAITLTASVVGAAVFLVAAPVDLVAAGVLAVSSLLGGRLGGGAARRLPAGLLRTCVVVLGGGAALALLLS